MGNTVGSKRINLFSNSKSAYILGLWCADGYHRTSSIGLSNTDEELINRFGNFLLENFPKDRIRLRVYSPKSMNKPTISKNIRNLADRISYCSYSKASKIAYHCYINSRPLLRNFIQAKESVASISDKLISSYIAGRFDGDGSIDKSLKKDCRIVYGDYKSVKIDKMLVDKIGYKTSLYHYQKAHTYCLYFHCSGLNQLLKAISPYSLKIQRLNSFAP